DHLVADQQRGKDASIEAAISGTKAIADMAQAMTLIDSASTVQQLEGLKDALRDAYQEGAITQEDYNNGLNLTNERIRALGTTASTTATGLDEVVKSLENFADVQEAISNAATDVDISKLGTAIRKMYADGKLTADEYKKAMAEVEKQKVKLTKATDEQSKAEKGLAGSIDEVTRAIEDMAKAEEEARKKQEEEDAARAQGLQAWGDYFSAVLTSVRTPLAQLSEQALATFDSLQGITNSDVSIDTSSIEATRATLARLREDMRYTQRELDDRLRNPFARWASEQVWQSQQIQEEYLQQKLALQDLMDRYERGTISLQGFRSEASRLRQTFTLLDQSDLSQLESAIASAKQQMQALGDSARNTLESVRDEL